MPFRSTAMDIYTLDAAAIVVALICMSSWLRWRKQRANEFPLPPGPRGLPIIGNVLDMPGKDEWEAARKWGQKYGADMTQDLSLDPERSCFLSGDLIYIENFGTPYLFLNSYEAVVDIFEKRGNIYTTKPSNAMMDMYVAHLSPLNYTLTNSFREGWPEWFAGAMPYGDEVRKIRQYLNKFFQKTVTKDYFDEQTRSTHNLLVRILQDPDNFQDHIRQ